jgi:hypothetical protein
MSSVNVRIVCKTTGGAFKNALALSIASGYIAAFTAGLRRMSWVDNKNAYPVEFSFVLNKLSQLKEAPRVMLGSLGFSNRCATPNTFEVFNGNIGVRAFGFCYDLFSTRSVNPRR